MHSYTQNPNWRRGGLFNLLALLITLLAHVLAIQRPEAPHTVTEAPHTVTEAPHTVTFWRRFLNKHSINGDYKGWLKLNVRDKVKCKLNVWFTCTVDYFLFRQVWNRLSLEAYVRKRKKVKLNLWFMIKGWLFFFGQVWNMQEREKFKY